MSARRLQQAQPLCLSSAFGFRISFGLRVSGFGFFYYMNWLLLKNSLLVGGLTTLMAVSLGLVAALWFAGLEARWRNRFLAVAMMALALPPFLVTNCWLHFLGYAGAWRSWLPLNIVSLGGTVWILSLLTWPITLLMVLSAWQRLEPSQLESDVAVSGWWLIRGLLWPLGRTALAQAAVLTFVLALNNFAVPAILQVKVFPAEMWVRFNTTFDTLGALRLSWPLVVAPLLLLLWFARREFPWPRMEGAVSARLFRQQLGPEWFWFSGACTILLCLLAVGLPVFQLVSVKRTWTELPGALAAGQSALWNSFFLAAAAATAIIAFALFACTRLLSQLPSGLGFRISDFCRWLAWLPFLLPGVLLGIGLIALFNRPWFSLLYQSAAIVILAFVIRYLALGWNSLVHALQTVDRDLTDAARLDGATRWQMLRYVQWPQVAPQAAAAWYIVFLLCLWDVESMILIVPPGEETLALRVFNLLHYGHNAQVNALCLTLLALAVLPLVVWKGWCVVREALSVHRTDANPRSPSSCANPSNIQHPTSNTQHRIIAGAEGNGCSMSGMRRCMFAFGSGGPTVIFACALALSIAGCAPRTPSNQAPLQSRLFRSVQIIGSRGVGVGQLNKPRSVAVDAQDNLYVVDMTGRVQKFSSNGVFLLSWQMPQTDLGKPKGLCRDHEGNIIVLEPHYQRVNVFSPEAKLLAQWGKRGTNAGEFTLPRAVAVDSRGEVFVSEYSVLDRVQRFTARGEKLLAGFGYSGTGPGELNRPEGLCVDAQDHLYVADSCNHRIQVFSRDGKLIRAYGKPGKGIGELSYPYDICIDATGRQYVCEFGNSRIQVFDANDQPLEIIGGPGLAPGQFNNPWGVALDSAGNLYVADSQNHRVQKLIR
jgi:ABC-type Fe3+ transport system permease subunit/DNA-binding beta-propeller fold protein YncE